jgi:hypothetical protein
MGWIVDLLSGAAGAALVAGIFGLIQARSNRKNAHSKALRYLMLYVIQERAKQHIKEGKITLEERRALHHWHSLYHNELGGNGDADALMAQVDKLPLDYDN